MNFMVLGLLLGPFWGHFFTWFAKNVIRGFKKHAPKKHFKFWWKKVMQVIWFGVCGPLKEKELRGKKLQKGLRIWMTRPSYSKVPKGTVADIYIYIYIYIYII